MSCWFSGCAIVRGAVGEIHDRWGGGDGWFDVADVRRRSHNSEAVGWMGRRRIGRKT